MFTFCIKMILKSWLFWLIWSFSCQIMTILTMAKFLENLLKDSTLSLFDILNIVFLLSSLFDSKMPLVNFLLDTRYFSFLFPSIYLSLLTFSQHEDNKENMWSSNCLISHVSSWVRVTYKHLIWLPKNCSPQTILSKNP